MASAPAAEAQSPAQPTESEKLAAGISSLEMHREKEAVPPHRSHDPQHNQKRSDPFQFGSRYLTEGDDVFEVNAWDHVEIDDASEEYAEQQYEMQRRSRMYHFDTRECRRFRLRFSTTRAGISDDILYHA